MGSYKETWFLGISLLLQLEWLEQPAASSQQPVGNSFTRNFVVVNLWAGDIDVKDMARTDSTRHTYMWQLVAGILSGRMHGRVSELF